MRITTIVFTTILLSSSAMAEMTSPDDVAHEFYAWVFSEPGIGSGLPTQNEMKHLGKFFSSALLKLLNSAIAMEKQCVENNTPGDKPHIVEGNIIVGNYEGATEIIVGQARRAGANAIVASRLFSIDTRFQKSHKHRAHTWIDTLVMSPDGGRWVISDIKFKSGQSLARHLKEYVKYGILWCQAPNTSLNPDEQKRRAYAHSGWLR